MAPFTDPIRPIGPVSGDVYVSRAEYAERVTRRFSRDQEDEGHGGRSHHHHGESPARQARARSVPVEEAPDAGAYDDHGQTMASLHADDPPHGHIDVSA